MPGGGRRPPPSDHNEQVRGLLIDMTPIRTSRPYRHLWLGSALSGIGSTLVMIAVALQVYDISGSTLQVGFVGLASFVPLAVLGLYGGSVVDAYDRRRVLVHTQVWLTVVGVVLTLVSFADVASVWVLYILVALQSGLRAVNAPARTAVIPRMVGPELLPAANAISTFTRGVALTVGPVIGGVLVDVSGYGMAYAVQAVLMALAIVTFAWLPPLPPEGEPKKAGLRSVLEGLRFLKSRPTIAMTFMADLLAMVLAMPRVLFPAIAAIAIGGGATTVGILVGGIAIGTMLGGLFSGPLGKVNRQGLAIIISVAFWGVFVTLFGLVVLMSPGPDSDGAANWMLWPATLLMVLGGVADTISAVFRATVLQLETPDAMLGRLQGVFIVVVAGGPEIGSLVLGSVASVTGEAWAAIVGGIACAVLVVLVGLRQRGLWDYDIRAREATST